MRTTDTSHGAPAIEFEALPALDAETIVARYTPLVRRVARSLALEIPGVFDLEDAVASGMCGLVEAVQRYDPGRGSNFHAFAVRRVRGSMIDSFRRMDRLSRTMRQRAREVDRVQLALQSDLGRVPTEAEVAAELGIPVENYRKSLATTRSVTVSLDHMLERTDGGSGEQVVAFEAGEDDDLASSLERSELRSHLVRTLRSLPEKDRSLIAMYYVERLSMREIAAVLGVSETRVSQRHAQIVRRLRAALMPHAA